MAIRDFKITPEQIAEKGVIAAPDTLTGTPNENKSVFDRLASEIIVPSVNGAIEMLGDVEDDTLEWAGDEAERKANELQRQQNEQERITAEQARQAAEALRQNTFAAEVAQAQEAAETAEAEADRAKAEADRAAAIVGGDYLSRDELGQPDGVAGLGPDGKVPEEQLPEMDFLPLSGGAMTGAVNMDGNAVTNLPAPVNDGDAARKADVDDVLHRVDRPVNVGLVLLAQYTSAGTYTWTVPDRLGTGKKYMIYVEIIGAGGGGGAACYYSSSSHVRSASALGGGSGHARFAVLTVTPGTACKIVVGAGGGGGKQSAHGEAAGSNGGSSSFNGLAAFGGNGGKAGGGTGASGSGDFDGADGGQGSSFLTSSNQESNAVYPYGGLVQNDRNGHGIAGKTTPAECISPFTGEILLCAGGFAYAYGTKESGITQSAVETGDAIFTKGSSGVVKYNANAAAVKGTAHGCGGGGAVTLCTSDTYTMKGADGADGAVRIYVQGGAE